MAWRQWLKAALGRIIFATGLSRAAFRNRAIVVLFHRIDDALPGDPVTCSRREFRSYCRFFRRHFVVVTLGELLGKLDRGEDVSNHLVITFDDGYLDNARAAAPELKALGLPACFFVATGFIGTERQAPWDATHGVTSVWMSWEDVRSLRAQGFEVGAHTVNHADLGVVNGKEAEREIRESRLELERELGTPITLFSYPFGRRENITQANRDLVRGAGFICCASAFGGWVPRGADPFALRRVPVSSWFGSPYDFGFQLIRHLSRATVAKRR